jgi:hypothetical protein
MSIATSRALPVTGVAFALGTAFAVLAGWLATARAQAPAEIAVAAPVPPDAAPAGAACAMCGVVSAVRVFDARGDAGNRASYRVTVRMTDGSYRTLAQPSPPAVGVGDRVRIAEGAVVKEN